MKLLRTIAVLASIGGGTLVLTLFGLDTLVMPYIVQVPRVRVPQLRGLSTSQARQRLVRVGLRLARRDSAYHESIPAGAIIDQTPQARTLVKKGRRVSVDISRGRRFYAVPDVRRVSEREARLQLEAARLSVGEVMFESSSSIPEGAVIEQVPRPGVELSPGREVDLKISSGSPATLKRVPALEGLPEFEGSPIPKDDFDQSSRVLEYACMGTVGLGREFQTILMEAIGDG